MGKKKEKVFTRIAKELLVEMGFKILRVAIESKTDFNRYADLTIQDKHGDKYLVEIKAYRKDYRVSYREFAQLINYLKTEKISKGIFITTSNTRLCKFNNLDFINGEFFKELLKIHGLEACEKEVEWVQQSRVNSKEREEYRMVIKNKILDHIKKTKNIPTKKEIQKLFGIDLRSVFGKIRPYEELLKEAKGLCSLAPTA